MIAEKQDRRVKRTKNLMRSALMELMDEKPFSEITAKDVTAKADLNRATFYLHYTNVFALLDEMENEVVEKFAQMLDKLEIRQGEAWESPLIGHICDYIRKPEALPLSASSVPKRPSCGETYGDYEAEGQESAAGTGRKSGIP